MELERDPEVGAALIELEYAGQPPSCLILEPFHRELAALLALRLLEEVLPYVQEFRSESR